MPSNENNSNTDHGLGRITLAMGNQPLLVYTIHPDDFAIGAAGTIYKVSQRGKKVYVVNMVPPAQYGGYRDTKAEIEYGILKQEFDASCSLLGCEGIFDLEKSGWLPKDFKSGTLGDPNPNDEVLEKIIIKSIRDLRPGAVLVPYQSDRHKDHVNGSKVVDYAAWRSGRESRVSELGEPWHFPNQLHEVLEYPVIPILVPQPGLLYVDITGEPSHKKLEAQLAHKSQMERDQFYWFSSWLRDVDNAINLHGSAALKHLLPNKILTVEEAKAAISNYFFGDQPLPMAEVFLPSGFASR